MTMPKVLNPWAQPSSLRNQEQKWKARQEAILDETKNNWTRYLVSRTTHHFLLQLLREASATILRFQHSIGQTTQSNKSEGLCKPLATHQQRQSSTLSSAERQPSATRQQHQSSTSSSAVRQLSTIRWRHANSTRVQLWVQRWDN